MHTATPKGAWLTAVLLAVLALSAPSAEAGGRRLSRAEILSSESNLPVTLTAPVMAIDLAEATLVIAEQEVLVVDADALPPVKPTAILDGSGAPIGLLDLQVGQKVRLKGLQHTRGAIVAVEIRVLPDAGN